MCAVAVGGAARDRRAQDLAAFRPSPLTAREFRHETQVSPETLARLDALVALLDKWRGRVNLVGAASMGDVWRRHILDSAQLFPHMPPSCRRLVDLGSGAGFPGLVLAILGARGVELIESDGRKCAFLAEAARVTEASVTIHNTRIEALPRRDAEVITARACAPLANLLAYAERHITSGGVCLFLKGECVDDELTVAAKKWIMRVDRLPSRTDPSGTILYIQGIARELHI